METTPGTRIRQWREFKGFTLSQVSRATGIKVTTLSTSEQPGANNPSFDTFSKLLGAYPDLNPDWLLTGTGPMLRDGKNLTPQERPTDAPTRTSQVPYAGPQLVAESDYIKEIKESRDRAIEEAETWKELYLSQIGKVDLLGKLPGSLEAVPVPDLTYTSRRRAGFTPTFIQLQEIEMEMAQLSVRGGMMWVSEEGGYATEVEEAEAA